MHYKVFSALALLTICSASKPIDKDVSNIDHRTETKDLITVRFSLNLISEGMAFLPPPYGIIMSIFSSTALLVYDSNNINQAQQSLQIAFHNIYTKLEHLSEEMNSGFSKLFDQLPEKIADDTKVEKMKKTIGFIKDWVSPHNIRCIAGECPEEVRSPLILEMINRMSKFRKNLRGFMNTYFLPNPTHEVNEAVGITSNIFDIILKRDRTLDDQKRYCSSRVTAQTRIFDFINYILIMVVESYTMIICAIINKFNDDSNNNNTRKNIDLDHWKEEAEIVYSDFRNDVLQFVQEAHRVLHETSTEFGNCDITYPKKGENYGRLIHFIEAQLYNAGKKYYNNDCSIGDVIDPHDLDYGFYSEMIFNRWCGRPSINEIWTDPSDPDRLYHHLAYYAGAESHWLYRNDPEVFETYGNPEGKNLVSRVYSNECKLYYCMVDRKKSKTSVRTINLDFIHSSPNYLVTGIRWVIKNKIVQLELQEGLLVNGSIDARTVRTLSAPNDTQNFVVLDKNTRELKFDELLLPRDYLITGVGLIFKNNIISFKIEGTKIDHEKWTLTTEKIVITPEFSSKEKMTKITFDDDFPPEVAPNNRQFNVQSKPGENYVEFGPTSFKKDAAQTTIPYFDTRYVSANSPYPLEGLGMYFNGLQGYGGYISFNIFAVNFMADFKVKDFEEFFEEFGRKIMNEAFNDST